MVVPNSGVTRSGLLFSRTLSSADVQRREFQYPQRRWVGRKPDCLDKRGDSRLLCPSSTLLTVNPGPWGNPAGQYFGIAARLRTVRSSWRTGNIIRLAPPGGWGLVSMRGMIPNWVCRCADCHHAYYHSGTGGVTWLSVLTVLPTRYWWGDKQLTSMITSRINKTCGPHRVGVADGRPTTWGNLWVPNPNNITVAWPPNAKVLVLSPAPTGENPSTNTQITAELCTWTNVGNANCPLTSYHPGGVNCLYVDGSVHFLGDTINMQSLTQLAVKDDGIPLPSF